MEMGSFCLRFQASGSVVGFYIVRQYSGLSYTSKSDLCAEWQAS